MKELNALFFREFTNKQFAVFFSHHIAIKTLNHHFFLATSVHNAIIGVKEFDVIAHLHIAILIFVAMFAQKFHVPKSLHAKAAGKTNISSARSRMA